ncbi:hypothetical protein ES703_50563 [subsurface metagenome]
MPGQLGPGDSQQGVLRPSCNCKTAPHVHYVCKAKVEKAGPAGFEDLVNEDTGQDFRRAHSRCAGQGHRAGGPGHGLAIDRTGNPMPGSGLVDPQCQVCPAQRAVGCKADAEDRILFQTAPAGQNPGHFHYGLSAFRGKGEGPDMLAGVLGHDPKANEVPIFWWGFLYACPNHSIYIGEGVYNPGKIR